MRTQCKQGENKHGADLQIMDYTSGMIRAPRGLLALLAGSAVLLAESGTVPRPKPADYPVQAQTGDMVLAAEYMYSTIAAERTSYVLNDAIVVELAAYPDKGRRVLISSGLFYLRINGQKSLLASQSAGMTAAGQKYPDWEYQRGIELGSGPVTIGRPRTQPRFPSDGRAGPTLTIESDGYGDAAPLNGAEAVVRWAFPDGEHGGPASGYLYFPFRKKLKSIRSLELVFHGDPVPIVLRLL